MVYCHASQRHSPTHQFGSNAYNVQYAYIQMYINKSRGRTVIIILNIHIFHVDDYTLRARVLENRQTFIFIRAID